MFEDDVGKDDIVLFLHEVASDIDEEEEHKRQWRIQHPIIYAINRLGWHLQMVVAGSGRNTGNDNSSQHKR